MQTGRDPLVGASFFLIGSRTTQLWWGQCIQYNRTEVKFPQKLADGDRKPLLRSVFEGPGVFQTNESVAIGFPRSLLPTYLTEDVLVMLLPAGSTNMVVWYCIS